MTTATLIPPETFTVQFREFSYTAYRLETLQSYAGSGEDEDLAAFRAGLPEPASPAKDEWTAMIADNHRAGKIQQRVDLVRAAAGLQRAGGAECRGTTAPAATFTMPLAVIDEP